MIKRKMAVRKVCACISVVSLFVFIAVSFKLFHELLAVFALAAVIQICDAVCLFSENARRAVEAKEKKAVIIPVLEIAALGWALIVMFYVVMFLLFSEVISMLFQGDLTLYIFAAILLCIVTYASLIFIIISKVNLIAYRKKPYSPVQNQGGFNYPGGYGQNPQGVNNQYTQGMNNQYAQGINNQYTQSVNNQYPQGMNNQYPQSVNNQYPQGMNNQYPQSTNNQYAQITNNQRNPVNYNPFENDSNPNYGNYESRNDKING